MVRDLIGPATAIAVLGAIESLLSAVVADGLTNDRHDSNTELVAQGIANIVCPFFGGLPATGAIARTSANVNNGGRSPISGIVHAITLLGIVLLFAKWAAYVPMAAMSAVLVFVALRMGEWHEMMRLRLMPLSDAVVLVTTFALTVVFDLVVAVEVGMVLAAMLFIKRVSETTEVSRVFESDVLESPEQLVCRQGNPRGRAGLSDLRPLPLRRGGENGGCHRACRRTPESPHPSPPSRFRHGRLRDSTPWKV